MSKAAAQQAVVGLGLALLVGWTGCRQVVGFEQRTPGAEQEGGAGGQPASAPISDGFEPPVSFASRTVSWLSSADFDGDGRREILSADSPDRFGQGPFALHYFDKAAAWVETRDFPKSTTPPAVRDVNGDGTSDLLFATNRVGLVPGRSDRAWLPKAFNFFLFPEASLRVASIYDSDIDGASGLAFLTTRGNFSGLYVPVAGSGELELMTELEGSVESLVGNPVAADLFEGSDSPCRELILPFDGASSFRVLDLCINSETSEGVVTYWRLEALQQVVSLPEPLTILGAPVVTDVNGDGHLDVLIGCDFLTCVAYGNGQELESVASELTLTHDAASSSSGDLSTPLAAGDFNADGAADFVLPEELLVSNRLADDSGYFYTTARSNTGKNWDFAQVADLNDNGLVDVVVASASGTGLTFFNGTGGPDLVPTQLATSKPVQQLVVGDFDGDMISDIAVVEGETSARLSLSFGAFKTVPPAPQTIAELQDVEQLGSVGSAGFDNLFVTSTTVVNGTPSSALATFSSSSDHLPLAGRALNTFDEDGSILSSRALAVTVGSFRESGVSDVIALSATANEPALWLLGDVAGDSPLPVRRAGELPKDASVVFYGDETPFLSIAGASGDLDGDGLDESVWLMPQIVEDPPGVFADRCSLTSHAFDAKTDALVIKASVSFDDMCPTPQLALRDLDGRDGPDLLVSIGDGNAGPRQLRILWNDGRGGFSESNQTALAVPDHDIRSFGVLATNPPQLVLVTDVALLTAARTGAGHDFEVSHLRDFSDPRAVVVADVNGDGAEDLAVADSEGIWLMGAHFR